MYLVVIYSYNRESYSLNFQNYMRHIRDKDHIALINIFNGAF